MFTLKLYKIVNGQKITLIRECTHVQSMDCGFGGETLELWAFDPTGDYATFYVGKREPQMTGLDGMWGWGLLENAAGKTSEHYRPYNYGLGPDCGDHGPSAEHLAAAEAAMHAVTAGPLPSVPGLAMPQA